MFRRLSSRSLKYYFKENIQIGLDVKYIAGPRKVQASKNDVILICVLRDGAEYIPAFMEHYHKLGIQHMVFLDNGSTDQTIKMLSAYPDVTVVQSTLHFGEFDRHFNRYLAKKYARNRWFLTVDIDELIHFIGEEKLTIPELLPYLNSKGYTAVRGFMLDMFSKQPLYAPEASFPPMKPEDYPYFEDKSIIRESIPVTDFEKFKPYKHNLETSKEAFEAHSGIRKRVFGTTCLLKKYPLQFMKGNNLPMFSKHDVRGAKIADFSTVLFHYKFTYSLFSQCDVRILENTFWNNSHEYRNYSDKLKGEKPVQLFSKDAVFFEDIYQLEQRGLVYASKDFKEYLNSDLVNQN